MESTVSITTVTVNLEKKQFVDFLNKFNEFDDDLTRFFIVVDSEGLELKINTADKTVVKGLKLNTQTSLQKNEKIVWGIFSIKKILKFLGNLSNNIKITLHYTSFDTERLEKNVSSYTKEFGKTINFIVQYSISDEKLKITQNGVSINQFNSFYPHIDAIKKVLDETGFAAKFKIDTKEFKKLYEISKISNELKYEIKMDESNIWCFNDSINYKLDIKDYNFNSKINATILPEKLIFIDSGEVDVTLTQTKFILKYENGFLVIALSVPTK